MALKEALEPAFVDYARNVQINTKALAEQLISKGYSIVTGGTDNHLLMWDVRPQGLNGGKMEWLYEQVHISVNKNTVYGDSSALTPGGIRLGTCALTSRRFSASDMAAVVEFLHRGIAIATAAVATAGKNLKEWKAAVSADAALAQLKVDVVEYSSKFYMPGREEY